MTPTTTQEFLRDLENELLPIQMDYATRIWYQRVWGRDVRFNDLDEQLRKFYARTEIRSRIESELTQAEQGSALERRLHLWKNYFIGAEIEYHPDVSLMRDNLRKMHNTFRPVIDGSERSQGEASRLLYQSDERLRREAFMANVPLSRQVEPELRNYVKLLNAKAQGLGYKNYYEMALGFEEVTSQDIPRALGEYEKAAKSLNEGIRMRGAELLKKKKLEPWDVAYVGKAFGKRVENMFDSSRAITLLETTLKHIGIDLGPLEIYIDAEERASKQRGAFCISMVPPTDVRIAINPIPGFQFYRTLFHEMGHALHAKHIKASERIFHEEPVTLCEVMSISLEMMLDEDEWQREVFKLDADGREAFRDMIAAETFAFPSSYVGRIAFERSLYENPDGDLHTTWCDTMHRYNGLDYSEHTWAAYPHHSLSPVYIHSYFLAMSAASSLHKNWKAQFGSVLAPAVGELYKDVLWGFGNRTTWSERIARATAMPSIEGSAVIDALNLN